MQISRFAIATAVLIVAAVPSGAQSSCEKLATAHFPNITIDLTSL